MFRIRRIFDDVIPVNRDALVQVREILKRRFSQASETEIDHIGDKLRNPFTLRFRPILFVAENMRHKVMGFAMVLHEPEIDFCYLDWIATANASLRGGLGSALYERVRSECSALGVGGLFFECLPDTDITCDQDSPKENIARLRFYERYGARPLVGTAYETPVKEGDTCMPFLVYDGLGRDKPLGRDYARRVVRAILERKYKDVCPQEYVELVVTSIRDNPVKLRPFCHVKPEKAQNTVNPSFTEKIALVINERHEILHIHERGYVESPVRVRSILTHLEKSGLFESMATQDFPDTHILAVHDADFIAYLARACEEVSPGKSLYPYVFPIRNKTRPPRETTVLPGYYCIDTFTPINRNAFPTARNGVNAALTAAHALVDGRRIAYALVRPPGHHAEKRAFGGFCYMNNTAIAAQYLRGHGRVAILDIDYHHGNGQQDIFYNRSDILTVSIHGHPSFAYPYFTGFEDETGEGEGAGFNLNFPLEEKITPKEYRITLAKALRRVAQFEPDFLVIALGLDTARNDPTGTWSLTPADFKANGRMIGETGLPILVVQEGGYKTRSLGINARNFFQGMAEVIFRVTGRKTLYDLRHKGLTLRYEPLPEDRIQIEQLVEATGFFRPDEVKIAGELVGERLEQGAASGYYFVIALKAGKVIGYGCYGPIPCTLKSYDIYWIAVSPDLQGQGLGKILLLEMERLIAEAGGGGIYVETSMQPGYATTRSFYERFGYSCKAVLDNFYGPGDGKGIYCK
ncbi:histone deacetylase superfamily protein [Desulforapulum autotrophicum HRM2]|uniref:Histone deacetylase superfamily protein n=1 Tax=Desulforapulum autotrophicum (strain ATCC 43914 / DSM 3382 / VKM B-1955 / HRM2) TaxID=177437 RepID=C0Q8U3_DESAH|nr:GNAT family N-acetyltransferase [Desulforapulum autotrophicum]ACN14433.1 histone deacetylase superfamily protein [Desulforapulum autotrophicum HRM2]